MARIRLLVVGFVVAGVVAAAAANAAGPPPAIHPDVPSLFAHEIRAIDASHTAPPVLLPATVPLLREKLYGSGGVDLLGWDLSIGGAKNCGNATACFIADFEAIKGGKALGTPVMLKGATKAAYKPSSCGASCAPASIDFVVHGVLYDFQVATLDSHNGKATMIALAQSAINAGPR
jgi:hypothetical protein